MLRVADNLFHIKPVKACLASLHACRQREAKDPKFHPKWLHRTCMQRHCLRTITSSELCGITDK